MLQSQKTWLGKQTKTDDATVSKPEDSDKLEHIPDPNAKNLRTGMKR